MRFLTIAAVALLACIFAPRTPPESARVAAPRPALPVLEACAPLRFAVIGDGRAGFPGVGPSAYKRAILGEVLARAPAFIVDTGDLVRDSDDPAEWARFLDTLPDRKSVV